MIEVSIGLPMFNSKNIGWLALESLCRQKNVDFKWELIVCEEQDENKFGFENINLYKDRLEEIGCISICYIETLEHISLSKKWKIISNAISNSSKLFIIQAADCYSQPYRLQESYNIIVNEDYDWVFSDVGPFYNIRNEEVVLYNTRRFPNKLSCGLNMGIKSNLFKKLPVEDVFSGVDSWIMNSLKPKRKKINKSENWKLGFDTDGLNNISVRRKTLMKTKPQIFSGIINIEEYIPEEIILKLKTLKQYCKD